MARRGLSFFTMVREHDNEDSESSKQHAPHIFEQWVTQHVSRLCQGIFNSIGLQSPRSLCKGQQITPNSAQHREQWDNRIIFPSQVQLKKQGTQTDKTSDRKHAYGRRDLLSDVDLSLSDMVQHSEGLWRC